MPIRDLELVLGPAAPAPTVHANRGANGIDGVLATALGVATASHGPTAVLIGDVATVHDLGGLAAIARSDLDLLIVVIDNDGGGIFSFLPVARHADVVHFDELFHTPHGTDIVAVARALGIAARDAASIAELRDALSEALAQGGPQLLRVSTSASDTVAAFGALRAALTSAPPAR
jgi:2-succinyl-5-enolpyruvyl-6-hydroxy-3-cyclohexene-1-carboxylate synthase